MEDHVKRMIAERTELEEKMRKLGDFITTNKGFALLSDEKQFLMRQQYEYMTNYQGVLQRRIELESY